MSQNVSSQEIDQEWIPIIKNASTTKTFRRLQYEHHCSNVPIASHMAYIADVSWSLSQLEIRMLYVVDISSPSR